MRTASYKQMRDRLVSISKERKCPVLGHFELTSRCNLDCKMCYVHTNNSLDISQRELSTDQWKRIFDEAYDLGMVYASLSGGECLLRKDFKELYLHLWNKHVYVTVLTNGTLLNDEYVEFFKTYMPDMIQISLYGSSEEGYLNVTGHKGFEKAINAISALEAAGIDVRVAVTPSKYMGDDFIKIYELCIERGFYAPFMEILLIENRDNPQKSDYFLSQEDIISLSIRRHELKKPVVPFLDAPSFCGPLNKPAKKGLVCNAGNCLATVTWDGYMHPCFNAMIEGVSLLDHSYADAWNQISKAASEIVLGVECSGCVYNETCPKCPSIRLKDYTSGHCKTSVCELTYKLVLSGVKNIITTAENCE